VSAGPNLLFILSDQHAQRVSSVYGDNVAETPNLARLAAEGVTFDACYTPSPICTPARMAMLTGRHPHQNRCWTNEDILASDLPTWLHALGAAGYAPTLIGRLHSLGPDQMRGYAKREIGDHSPNWPGIPRHAMGVLEETNNPDRVSIDRSGAGQSAYELLDRDVVEATLAHLDHLRQRRAEGDRQPFALTVGLMLPHAPYVASTEDFERFAGKVPPPRLAAPAAADEHPWLAWWRRVRQIEDVPAEDARRARIAYYALTYRMDQLIGRVLERLQANGLADDTLVVYASDHGDQIGERGLWWKHTFYDDSAKVPVILSWPGRLPAGERRAQVVNLIDLTATMVEALGAPALPAATGRSFLDVAKDASAPWIDETFSEYCTDPTPAWTGAMAVQQRMIRSGRWKYVYYHGHPAQLFDLEADPEEGCDLIADPAHAAVAASLRARLLADWDPDAIARDMTARHADKRLLGAWAAAVRPQDSIRWPLTAAMNRLDAAD
jgi:choline-sulfatase